MTAEDYLANNPVCFSYAGSDLLPKLEAALSAFAVRPYCGLCTDASLQVGIAVEARDGVASPWSGQVELRLPLLAPAVAGSPVSTVPMADGCLGWSVQKSLPSELTDACEAHPRAVGWVCDEFQLQDSLCVATAEDARYGGLARSGSRTRCRSGGPSRAPASAPRSRCTGSGEGGRTTPWRRWRGRRTLSSGARAGTSSARRLSSPCEQSCRGDWPHHGVLWGVCGGGGAERVAGGGAGCAGRRRQCAEAAKAARRAASHRRTTSSSFLISMMHPPPLPHHYNLDAARALSNPAEIYD